MITTPLWKTLLTLHSVLGLSVCTPAPGWITYHWGSSSTEHPHVRLLYISRYITEVAQEYCGRDDNPQNRFIVGERNVMCVFCSRVHLAAVLGQTIGTLRNYDGDGKENVKKAIGLIGKKTTTNVHHAFLYISLLSLHNYYVKWPNFKFTWERERQGD